MCDTKVLLELGTNVELSSKHPKAQMLTKCKSKAWMVIVNATPKAQIMFSQSAQSPQIIEFKLYNCIIYI